MNLTPDQLTTIDYQLRYRNLLHNEELVTELTDHFALAISEQMATGQSFDEAGRTVLAQFGGWNGLVRLQKQYVNARNQAAWTTFGQMALRYLTTARLLVTLALALSMYSLLTAYWQETFYGLGLINLALYVLTSFGISTLSRQKWSWKDADKSLTSLLDQPVATIRNSQAGMRWVISIVYVVSFNVPIFLYLHFFPPSFGQFFARLFDLAYYPVPAPRPFEAAYPIWATVGFMVSYIGFFCIAELTSKHNRLLRRFVQ